MDHNFLFPVAVAKFTVTPGNELDKVVIEGNVNPSTQGGGVGVSLLKLEETTSSPV